MTLRQIWELFFADHVIAHRRDYTRYILVLSLYQLCQVIILPRVVSTGMNMKSWTKAPSLGSITALIAIFTLSLALGNWKARMEAVLPALHTQWMRVNLFESLMTTFKEDRTPQSVGTFLTRYNVMPREVRYLLETLITVAPVLLTVLFLWVYFMTVSVPCGLLYAMLVFAFLAFFMSSKERQRCVNAVRRRARIALVANEKAGEEMQNLEHIYAHQKEDARISHQRQVEQDVASQWRVTQLLVVRYTTQLQIASMLIYFCMIFAFLHVFHRHPDKRSQWPTVFLTLSWAQATLITLSSKCIAIMNSIATIEVNYTAMATTNPAPKSPPPPKTTPSAMPWPLRLHDVCLIAHGKTVFVDMNWTLYRGDRVLVTGASGSGKSTLFSLLTGYVQPDNGAVLLGKEPLRSVAVDTIRTWIVHMPQSTMLYGESIYYNVFWKHPTKSEQDKLDEMIDYYGLATLLPRSMLTEPTGALGARLSHGMRKVILLLRTYMQITAATELVLLDEPFASLDDGTRTSFVMPLIQRIATGRTIMVSNHVALRPEQQQFFTRHLSTSQFHQRR